MFLPAPALHDLPLSLKPHRLQSLGQGSCYIQTHLADDNVMSTPWQRVLHVALVLNSKLCLAMLVCEGDAPM